MLDFNILVGKYQNEKESEMITIPRVAREYLTSVFFHVIVQGINKEYIFNKENYKKQYLKIINQYSKQEKIEIIAYCIMDNHAHFLVKVKQKENMSKLMQKVNTKYAKYYNYKEDGRAGYVFRDRFISEPIKDGKHFWQCINYIHLNPVKAHIVQKCEDYPYSSYGKENNLKSNQESNDEYCDDVFLDVDVDIEEKIKEGIAVFIRKYNKNVIDIFTKREVLKQLIKYLKNEKKIKYSDIIKKLEITKGTMERLKR